LLKRALSQRVWTIVFNDLEPRGSRRNIAAVWPWIAQTLWVIYRIHAQLKLRLIRVPALRADQQLIVLGLNDFALKHSELKALITAITLGNRVLAGSKPIAH
jgi:hypothetical protein